MLTGPISAIVMRLHMVFLTTATLGPAQRRPFLALTHASTATSMSPYAAAPLSRLLRPHYPEKSQTDALRRCIGLQVEPSDADTTVPNKWCSAATKRRRNEFARASIPERKPAGMPEGIVTNLSPVVVVVG